MSALILIAWTAKEKRNCPYSFAKDILRSIFWQYTKIENTFWILVIFIYEWHVMKIQGDRNNYRKDFAPLFLNMSLTHSTTLNILLNCFDEAMMSLHCFIEHDRFFARKFAFYCTYYPRITLQARIWKWFGSNFFFSLQVMYV